MLNNLTMKMFHKHAGSPVKEFIIETAIMTYNWRVTISFCNKCKKFYCEQVKTNDK